MEQENPNQFEGFETIPFSRRDLLPIWMKVFCWFFMFMGLLSAISFIQGLFGSSAGIEFYGLNDDSTLSLKGLVLTAVLIFKAFTTYSLWFQKDYAITLGKIDAVSGVIICIIIMALSPSMREETFTIRFEICLLTPYYFKLNKIGDAWHKRQY